MNTFKTVQTRKSLSTSEASYNMFTTWFSLCNCVSN